MATIRQELESRLATFASAYSSPVLQVAWESIPFTKPDNEPFLECFIIPAGVVSATLDASRTRERGTFQVNVWCPSGVGSGLVEGIARDITAAFPVVPKIDNVSIEQPGNISRLITDLAGWIILPIMFSYRVEGTA